MVLILLVGFGLALEHTGKSEWNKVINAWANERGVEVTSASWQGADGELDGVPIAVESVVRKHGKSSTRYTILRVTTDLPPGTVIGSENTLGASFAKMFKGADIETGDETFDRSIVLRGDETELLARMSSSARESTLAVVAAGAKLEGPMLVMEMAGTKNALALLTPFVEPLVAFAKAVRDDGETTLARLVRNATEDPDPGVRARNVRELVRAFRTSRETGAALVAGLQDEAAVVRLEVAVAIRTPEAVTALEGLVADSELEDAVRVRAARALAKRAPGSGTLRAAQAFLTRMLMSGTSAVALMAAQALGDFAGIDAVEALLPHTRGLFRDGDLKEATTRAVAAIQARAGGAAGALSLVEEATAGDGALSLADNP